jgi:very-short-patch-repair endonuclease/transcription elongation GreA/GreB family factor
VISLVGAEQAEHIRSRLSETIGEEIMQRHSILCGDSATFQGSERDIVFLSMVADSANKTALTMLRYEQRFNVAVSRARDRVVLVRSVRREELNPSDLKARLIAHFENPMPELKEVEDALAVCESDFERDLMQRLLERGYHVRGQVGSIGYRIDMVVEGAGQRRLAVECDGDRFHGPEQWRQDMRRQRVLERVGWRFWRCFASSFYRDPDGALNDLLETLTQKGIEPLGDTQSRRPDRRLTEHRTIKSTVIDPLGPEVAGRGQRAPTPEEAKAAPTLEQPHKLRDVAARDITAPANENVDVRLPAAPEPSALRDVGKSPQRLPAVEIADAAAPAVSIGLGDKIVLVFSDDQRRISARLSERGNDLERGQLAINSPLGRTIFGAEEGDEVELLHENGRHRKVLIEKVERSMESVLAH